MLEVHLVNDSFPLAPVTGQFLRPPLSHKRPDRFADECAIDVVRLHHVEDDDWLAVVHAEAERGGVHHLQALRERVGVGDVVEAFRVRIFLRVGIVDAIDLRGLEDGLGADLGGAQGGGRVGGKKRVARAGDENHDTAEFEVAGGSADDERLGEVLHFDGGLHADFDAEFLEGGHEGEAVDDGREHAHVVSLRTIHASASASHAAPDMPL